jgi:hypothetical protein
MLHCIAYGGTGASSNSVLSAEPVGSLYCGSDCLLSALQARRKWTDLQAAWIGESYR